MKIKTVFILLGLLVQIAHSAQEGGASDVVTIRTKTAPQLFRTMPFYVAVEITNGSQQTVEFPEWNVLRVHLPLTMHLKNTSGQEYSSPVERYGFIVVEADSPDGPVPVPRNMWRVPPGETRRFLANFGSSFQQLNVPNGTYTLSIQLWADMDKSLAVSEPLELTIADRPTRELATLPGKPILTVRGATDLKTHITPQEIKSLGSKELRETLGFTSLLHEILTTQNLSTLPINDYRELVGEWLLPEIEEIEFEVLLAKRDKSKADLVRDAVLKRSPAMKFWTDAAERGQGYCQTIRKMK